MNPGDRAVAAQLLSDFTALLALGVVVAGAVFALVFLVRSARTRGRGQ